MACGVWWVSNGHVADNITWPQRCCEAVRSAILATVWLFVLELLLKIMTKFGQRRRASLLLGAWNTGGVWKFRDFWPISAASWKWRETEVTLMDVDGLGSCKSGRQRWRYADAFQRSIISEAIYHVTIYVLIRDLHFSSQNAVIRDW